MSSKNRVLTFPVVCLMISTVLVMISLGISSAAIPSILTKNSISPTLIGVSSMSYILGGIIISFLLTHVVAKFGAIPSLLIAAALNACALVLMSKYVNFGFWLVLVFILGVAKISALAIRQAWLNIVAGDNKGTIIGIASFVACIGLFLGTITIKLFGDINLKALALASGLFSLSIIVLIMIRHSQPQHLSAERLPLIKFLKHDPRCFIGKFLTDMQFSLMLSFVIVFGNQVGFTTAESAVILCGFLVSGVANLSVGPLLKRIDIYKLIYCGFVLCLIVSIIMVFIYESYMGMTITYFIYGCIFSIPFTAVFILANSIYKEDELLAVNASLSCISLISYIVGSILYIGFLQAFGYMGFLYLIISINAFYVIVCLGIKKAPKMYYHAHKKHQVRG